MQGGASAKWKGGTARLRKRLWRWCGLQTFGLVTDHEALKVIYSRGSKPSACIERWVLRLQPYNYKVCCVTSRDNIADAVSRLTKIHASGKSRYDDEYVRMVASGSVPVALKIQEIERVSAEDDELQVVCGCLVSGNWEGAPKSYVCVRNELTFIGHVILRGTRIVITQKLRQRVLRLLHEGHQGTVKMKERLRSKVLWPGVDKDAERKCRECYGCQLVTKETNSTCEDNTVARETMARSGAGLTWALTNRGAPVSLGRLFQLLGGS